MEAATIIRVVALLAAFGGGWKVRDWQWQSEKAAQAIEAQKAEKQLREFSDEIAGRTEKAIQAIRIDNKTINQEVIREVRTNTVYRDCIIPDSGLQLANKARSGQAAGKSAD